MASTQDEPKTQEADEASAAKDAANAAAPADEAAATSATVESRGEGPEGEDEGSGAEASTTAEASGEETPGDGAGGDAGPAADGDEGAELAAAARSEEAKPSSGAEAASKGGKSRSGKGAAAASMSAGQRLAAAKAAKAARKAAQRGREATQLEDRAIARATDAADWLRANQTKIATALVGALVVGAAIVGWGLYSSSKAEAAAALLYDGVRTVLASVGPAGMDPDAEHYETAEARTQAALPELREVVTEHPATTAAVWASLAEGAELLGSGNAAEARRAYEGALASSHGSNATRARALEGIGFTYEADDKLDEALSRFEELGRVDHGFYEDLADYHIARVKAARGDTAAAVEMLRELVSRLQEQDAPAHPYLRGEAEGRLAVLDPTYAGINGRGMPRLGNTGSDAYPTIGEPGGELSEERLQELIRQIQEQQRAAGGE